MNELDITSAQYVADEYGQNCSVTLVSGGVTLSVPLDPANRHYAAILEWVADGNTIADAD